MNPKKLVQHKSNVVSVSHRNIVGIDIGKRKHAATALSPKGECLARLTMFENNRDGVDLLEREVLIPATKRTKPLIAMEATGHYWNALYDELSRRGYSCVVLNPLQTHARGKNRIRKTKTDAADSDLIARTILAGDALATVVPDEFLLELRLLVRHRFRLIKVHGMILRYAMTLIDRAFPEYEKTFCKPFLPSVRTLIREVGLTPGKILQNPKESFNILKRASRGRFSDPTLDELLLKANRSIGSKAGEATVNFLLVMAVDYFDFVENQIQVITNELRNRMATIDCPLMSLGISPEIAATILAESGSFEHFPGSKQYTAFCGLDPSIRDSGDSIHGISHISKRGSPLLRWAMFITAQTVCKKHHDFKRIYDRHRNRHKTHKFALTVVARKVARVVWRIMNDNRPFTKRPPKPSC